MSIVCDFHLHSGFSEDSSSPMEEMVRAAAEKGLKILCFTEHYDLDYPEGCGEFRPDMEAYVSRLFSLRETYRDRIQIRLGLELGMQSHLGEAYRRLAGSFPFDFLIASQHLVEGADPYYPEYWQGRREEEVYRSYFETVLCNIRSMEEFDTLGHLDYIVRYGPNRNRFYSFRAYEDVITPILQELIRRNKCLEVNTAGLKYGLGHPNPEEDVLRRYRELGGRRITIGSDAHKPEHIAWEFQKAEKILLDLGFTHYTVFQNRIPLELPLGR